MKANKLFFLRVHHIVRVIPGYFRNGWGPHETGRRTFLCIAFGGWPFEYAPFTPGILPGTSVELCLMKKGALVGAGALHNPLAAILNLEQAA